LIKMFGKDATTAFFGGVYDHSNAAHNVSSSQDPFLDTIFKPNYRSCLP
jgi:cytochrome b involved in lipid metabolism